jgi:putative FmdB family regulatory protein
MPTYSYVAEGERACAHCAQPFDVRQRIDDDRLRQCPECGAPVRRVISAPALTTGTANLSESNLEKHGFTQYRKREKGVYEKTTGRGPKVIRDDS